MDRMGRIGVWMERGRVGESGNGVDRMGGGWSGILCLAGGLLKLCETLQTEE